MIVRKGACTDPALVEKLATTLVTAITAPQLDLMDSLFSDDFTMWYGISNSSLDRTQALDFFRRYFPTITLRYDDIVCTPTATGWIQQHLVNTEGADGFKVSDLPVCMVVTVKGDKISRMDEYFDSAQTVGFDASQMTQA